MTCQLSSTRWRGDTAREIARKVIGCEHAHPLSRHPHTHHPPLPCLTQRTQRRFAQPLCVIPRIFRSFPPRHAGAQGLPIYILYIYRYICIYIHTYIHTHTHTHMHTHAHTHTHIHIHSYLHIHMYTHTHICTYLYVYTHIILDR